MSEGTPEAASAPPQRSFVLGFVIVVGVLMAVFGVIATVIGLGGSNAFAWEGFGIKFSTTATGLVFLVAGLLLALVPMAVRPEPIPLGID